MCGGTFQDTADATAESTDVSSPPPMHDHLVQPLILPCRDAFSDALDAIHSAGVLHGDLHAGNLLVDERGAVTIIDFGKSTILAPAQMPSMRRAFQDEKATLLRVLSAVGSDPSHDEIQCKRDE